MGLKVLQDGHAWMLRTLFAPPAYYRRIKILLKEYPSPAGRRPLSKANLKAMCRAMISFGVVGAERWEYWKLLAWTLRHKPRLLAMAVRLAAIGHHHRLMSDKLSATLAAKQESDVPPKNVPVLTS